MARRFWPDRDPLGEQVRLFPGVVPESDTVTRTIIGIVGDVRGSGFFIGVELVRDRTTLEPATADASDVVDRMREEGILIGTDGPHHNVLKIRPPMPFTIDDAEVVASTLGKILTE